MAKKLIKTISIKSIKLRPRKIKQPKPIKIEKPKPIKIEKPKPIKIEQQKPIKIEQSKSKNKKYKRRQIKITSKQLLNLNKKALSKKVKKKKQKQKQLSKINEPVQEIVSRETYSKSIIEQFKENLQSINNLVKKDKLTADRNAMRIERAIDNLILNYGVDKVADMLEEMQYSGEIEMNIYVLYDDAKVTQIISRFASLIKIDDNFADIIDVIGDTDTLDVYGSYLDSYFNN